MTVQRGYNGGEGKCHTLGRRRYEEFRWSFFSASTWKSNADFFWLFIIELDLCAAKWKNLWVCSCFSNDYLHTLDLLRYILWIQEWIPLLQKWSVRRENSLRENQIGEAIAESAFFNGIIKKTHWNSAARQGLYPRYDIHIAREPRRVYDGTDKPLQKYRIIVQGTIHYYSAECLVRFWTYSLRSAN